MTELLNKGRLKQHAFSVRVRRHIKRRACEGRVLCAARVF